MSNSFSHHWPLESHGQQADVPANAEVLKHDRPRLYARVIAYLREKFSLEEEDLRQHGDVVRLFMESADCFEHCDRFVIEHVRLFRCSVKNALMNLGVDLVDEEELAERTDIIRENIGTTFEGVETFLEGFYPFEAVDALNEEMVPALRDGAVQEMDARFGGMTETWPEPESALQDPEMERRFIERAGVGSRFLTTYCDSACFGLVDKTLQAMVDQKTAHCIKRQGWPRFKMGMKKRITRSLESIQPGQERRFLPENCFFAESGTQAFRRFREACIPEGGRVLATSEEYFELVEDMERKGIEVVTFSDVEDLIHKLDGSSFDCVLVSEVGRLGTVFPLRDYHEVIKLLSPNTKLVVDSVQSAGRWKHDLGIADVVILNARKGSDLGDGMGVLAFADDFEYEGVSDPPGSLAHEQIGRTAFALNPDGLSTLTPVQRAEAISDRMKKFLELIQAVNTQADHRIQVLSPLNSDSEIIGHAVQLKVDGVSREEICELAESYGVYIADKQVAAKDDQSVRIAFHPYMDNRALKIIAYVLLLACDVCPVK